MRLLADASVARTKRGSAGRTPRGRFQQASHGR
jgi:hypothetical protein